MIRIASNLPVTFLMHGKKLRMQGAIDFGFSNEPITKRSNRTQVITVNSNFKNALCTLSMAIYI